MKPSEILTKELLQLEFVDNKLSAQRIAEKYGIKSSNSVEQAIKRHGLSRENQKLKLKNVTRDWLYQKYVVEDMSAKDIAALFGYKRKASVLSLLHKLDIPIRKTTKTKKFKKHCMDKRTYGEMTSNYYNSLKYMAQYKRNKEWAVSGEYLWELFLKQNRKCALSGIELQMCDTCLEKSTQTASVDRIDSSLGYIEGNVQWIHKDLNKMKWNLSQKDFINWCHIISERHKYDSAIFS